MPTDTVQRLRPAAADRAETAWPVTSTSPIEFSVALELKGATLRIVRRISCDGAPVFRLVTWSADYPSETDAADAYEALNTHQADLQCWSAGATALGADWLTPTIVGLVAKFVDEREGEREKRERAELAAREKAEKEAAEENSIEAYFREKEGCFRIELQRGFLDDGVFWSIAFEERWERDRFWDWLGWQTARFDEFSKFLEEGTRLDLERTLLREMLVTEQTVKKQGLGSGGRRPLRFWRGEP